MFFRCAANSNRREIAWYYRFRRNIVFQCAQTSSARLFSGQKRSLRCFSVLWASIHGFSKHNRCQLFFWKRSNLLKIPKKLKTLFLLRLDWKHVFDAWKPSPVRLTFVWASIHDTAHRNVCSIIFWKSTSEGTKIGWFFRKFQNIWKNYSCSAKARKIFLIPANDR